MPTDRPSPLPLIRRAASSALVLAAGWLVFKALDTVGGALWTALASVGGWPLALAGVSGAGLALSVVLAVTAGRIRVPAMRAVTWGAWAVRHGPYAMRDVALRRRVSRGSDNPRWQSRSAFEDEDPRRIGAREQLHTSFGFWNDDNPGGLNVLFIHCTGEIVAVRVGSDTEPVELLGHARDEHHADQLLKDYEYVQTLRWARYRAGGWRVPLPPADRWWYDFDRRPPRPWPAPPAPSVGRAVGAYYGRQADDLNCVIEIVDGAQRRELYHAVDSSPTGLAWGYSGAGPTDTARSLLWDRLGYVPQPRVVYAFRDEVVAELPGEFIMSFADVDDWIDTHGSLIAHNPRAQPMDRYAAGGAYR